MTTSIRTSSDGLSSIIAINGVDKLTVDSNGKVTATKFSGDGSELTGLIKSGTAINTTSGTAHDFTGIPSWVKRITIIFADVSTSGLANPVVRVGSGSISTSGYSSSHGYVTTAALPGTATDGFQIPDTQPGCRRCGTVELFHVGSNVWVCKGDLVQQGGNSAGKTYTGGYIPLGAVLDRIRITTVNGTDLFDAGQINILYE